MRMSLHESEFTVLRHTIASRGTVRVVLLVVTVLGWSALTVVLLLFSTLPVASVYPLAVLAAGFEAIHALHVGVERIGRYLQVYYEADGEGPGLGAGGVHGEDAGVGEDELAHEINSGRSCLAGRPHCE